MNLAKTKKDLYEAVKHEYFSRLELAIDGFSRKDDQQNRLKAGSLYNALSGIKLEIKNVDCSSQGAKESLDALSQRLNELIRQINKICKNLYAKVI